MLLQHPQVGVMELLILPFLAHCMAAPQAPRASCPQHGCAQGALCLPCGAEALPSTRSDLSEIAWVKSASSPCQHSHRGSQERGETRELVVNRDVGDINSCKFTFDCNSTDPGNKGKLRYFISYRISFLEALTALQRPP